MPSVSLTTAEESISLFGIDVRLTNLEGGYTVCFESHSKDQDLGPLFEGLPDDQCQFILRHRRNRKRRLLDLPLDETEIGGPLTDKRRDRFGIAHRDDDIKAPG